MYYEADSKHQLLAAHNITSENFQNSFITMLLRKISSSILTSRFANLARPQSRLLSYQGESAVRKLQQVMEAYRVAK